MALETPALTIADLDRMDAEDDAREAHRKAVAAIFSQVESPYEAA